MLALLMTVGMLAPPPPVWPNADHAEPFKPAAPISKAEQDRVDADKLYTVGILRLRQDRMAEGLQDLREAIAKAPTHLPALKQAALAAQLLDRRDEALDYCRRAVALDPKDADRLYIAGLILAAKGADAEALSFLERARDVPNLQFQHVVRYVAVRELLVILYEKKRAHEPLAHVLGDILELVENPDRYDLNDVERRVLTNQRLALHLKRADALRQAKKYSEAEAALRTLIDKQPVHKKRILADVAQIQLEAGKPLDSISTLEEHFSFGESNFKTAFDTLEMAFKQVGSAEFIPKLEHLAKNQPNNNALQRLLAFKLFHAGQFKRAEGVLQQLGSDRDTIPLLLRTYIKLRNAPRLLRTLQRLLQNRASDDEVLPVLEELKRDKDLLKLVAKEASSKETALQTSQTEQERLLDLVARLAYQAGDYEVAAEVFKKCLDVSPQAREFHRGYAISLYFADKRQECLKAIDGALALEPDDLDLIKLKGSAMAQLGKTDDAVKMLEQVAAKTKSAEQLLQVRLGIASAYRHAKQYAKSAEIYRAVLEEFPQSQEVFDVRYSLSGVYSIMNENKKAEAELLKIIDAGSTAPADVRVRASNDLGFLWVDEGRHLERAEAMIRYALKAEPDNPAYIDSLGWALFKRGRFSDAKELLQKAATAKTADDPVIWEHLGDVHLQLGDKSGAAKAWRTAVKLYDKGIDGAPKEKGGVLRGKAAGALGKEWQTKDP